MVFAKTDIGKAREQNQDYYYITPDDESPKIYILADGMGGYRGGEVASNLATNAVREYVKNNFKCENTKEELLEKLWNDKYYLEENVLLVNINRLRKKAQEIGIEDLLENVRGKGYKL